MYETTAARRQPEIGVEGPLERLRAEAGQALAIAIKDVRVYYLTPPMVMFGLLMPFFMFFSFSVGRGMGQEASLARLLALTTFFTASSAGPVILPMERRVRTFDRLLVAPVSLISVLLGKSLVGTFFGLAVAMVPLVGGLLAFGVRIADPLLLAAALLGSSLAFAALGILFGSVPAQNPGSIMMPSTLVRWPLLFISGVFIPLREMDPWARALSYASPLTYAQDLFDYAVSGAGAQGAGLDLVVLPALLALFLLGALKLHGLSRRMGY
ncbi:MAG: ABC transporter permease [Chloroflexi bacterium]|nr:ABC transporter permease [Chloroflexota bacterium]